MSTTAGTDAYPTPKAPLRPNFRSVLAVTALTSVTFIVLPFFGLLSKEQHEIISLRPALDIVLAPPAPKHSQMKKELYPVRKNRPKLREQPRLNRPKQHIRSLKTQISLSMSSLNVDAGDFQIDFTVKTEATEKPEADEKLEFIQLSQLDQHPRPLVCMKPVYPFQAKNKQIEGFVEVLFTISKEGRVTAIKVVRSKPGDIFVSAAKKAIIRWRFTPPLKDGKAVAVRVRQVIKFQRQE